MNQDRQHAQLEWRPTTRRLSRPEFDMTSGPVCRLHDGMPDVGALPLAIAAKGCLCLCMLDGRLDKSTAVNAPKVAEPFVAAGLKPPRVVTLDGTRLTGVGLTDEMESVTFLWGKLQTRKPVSGFPGRERHAAVGPPARAFRSCGCANGKVDAKTETMT